MKRNEQNHITRHFGSICIRYMCTYLLSFVKHSNRRKSILVTKVDALGDQVVSSFVLQYLKEKFADHTITILVQEQVEEFYKSCPFVDSIITLDKKKFFRSAEYALREIRRIRSGQFSIVIHAVHSRDPAGEQITTASGAQRVIGLAGDDVNEPRFVKRAYDWRYTELVPEWEPYSNFEGHRYLSIPKYFGYEVRELDWRPMVWVNESDRVKARELLAELELTVKGFALIAPGAGDRTRCWNAEGFSYIGDRLFAEKGLCTLLVGAPGEEDLADKVRDGMRSPCKSVVGKTSVSLLAALSTAAAIVVGNESAPIHFSAAVGIPTTCVIGGGHYGRFFPYPGRFPLRCVTNKMECFGCDWECKYVTPYCITRVQPEQVWSAVSELLDIGQLE